MASGGLWVTTRSPPSRAVAIRRKAHGGRQPSEATAQLSLYVLRTSAAEAEPNTERLPEAIADHGRWLVWSHSPRAMPGIPCLLEPPPCPSI